MSFRKPTRRVVAVVVSLEVSFVLGWLALLALGRPTAPVSPVWAWEVESVDVQASTATLSLPQATVAPGGQVTVPLTLALPQGQVYAADIVVTYDSTVVTAIRVERGALASGWSLASNRATPGVVRVALAGTAPIASGGELLRFVFDAVGANGSGTVLALTRGDLNEGAITAALQDGFLSVAPPNTIPLTAGWNLVSFNVTPDAGNAITDVLSSVMSDLIVVQGYDGGAQSYFPGGAQNTLHTMDALHGYWLKLSAPANLTIPGTKVAVTTTIPLQAGWNLVSYLPEAALPREIALASIAGRYTAVLGYEQGAESWYAALPDSMNTLTMMKPGHGYWIYMTEAADLVYP